LDRRNFLGLSTSASTALLLSSFETFSLINKSTFSMNTDFELKIMATNWGFRESINEYCALVKKEGYDGIEIWWPTEKKDQDELFNALKKNNLDVGFLVAGYESNFKDHFESFKKMINAAATNNIQKPIYINCHSGKDYFSFDDNKMIIDYTIQIAKQTGIKVCNETHRSRILFAAPIAKQFIEKIPELRLTLDISHWCNVHESLLQDQQETIDLALSRTDHIHARIGHQEGPQVNDPRAPEWNDAVKAHFAWWDKIVEEKKKAVQGLTILTEFGPPHYMPALPYTVQPVADQWAINVYMMNTLRKRYL
jgi:sugar phosphate isomerase/epimerase